MPGIALKICAMPTASETAPPGRPTTLSPTSDCSSIRLTIGMFRLAKTAGDVLMA